VSFGQFKITTQGFGTIVWQPSYDLSKRLSEQPSRHPQGAVVEIAQALATLCELLSVATANEVEMPQWFLDNLAASGAPTSVAGALHQQFTDDRKNWLRHLRAQGQPEPAYQQELDAVPMELDNIRLREKLGTAR
jgi:hypothetical protein